jgi:glycosyltransferase involved in cell wall biosynthesis
MDKTVATGDRKLNILQVHNFYRQPGGEDTVAANEKRLLEEAGHTVVTYYRSNDELAEKKGLRRLTVPFTAVYSFRTYREVRRLLREHQIDLVHVHNTHMMVSPSVFYACFRAHVPVVQTLHNFRLACPAGVFYRDGQICEECLGRGLGCSVRHGCYRGSRAQTLVNAAVTGIHRWLGTYRRVYFICLTAFNRDKLLELNKKGRRILDEQKLFVKPNFSFGKEAVPADGAADAGDEPLLFVGRLEEIKGALLAALAMELLPEERLLVAGDGALMETLQEYVSTHRMTNVTFLGRLSQEQLAGYYDRAKAVISCSQCYESFPMVLTEAYAHGVPVIAGAVGNMTELVQEGVTGFHFAYDDAESLADAVRKLDEASLPDLRKNARYFYEQRLTAAKNLECLEEIYRKILGMERDH